MSDAPLANFDGYAKLFPLPNLVLYPHVVQPLHMFEPRYRQLTADALATDRLITMTLLRPGWEEDYAGAPDIYPIACIGKVISDQKLDDGRYNIYLRGLHRVTIGEEVATDKLYRIAEVDLLDELPPDPDVAEKLRNQLHSVIPDWLGEQQNALQQFQKLLSQVEVGAFCDIVSFALPLGVEFKQELLEELNVERRIHRLIDHMKSRKPKGSAKRKFPPDFSEN